VHAYHANVPPGAQDNQLHEPNEAHKRIWAVSDNGSTGVLQALRGGS